MRQLTKHFPKVTIIGATLIVVVGAALILGGASSPSDSMAVPTLMVLPSFTPTEQVALAPTATEVIPPTTVERDTVADGSLVPVAARLIATPLLTVEAAQSELPAQTVDNQVIIHFDPSATDQQRTAYITAINGTVTQNIAALDTVVVSLPPESAAQPLFTTPIVTAAEPDYYVQALVDVPTSDQYFGQQWGLSAIHAPQAWNSLPADAPTIAVAVIDSGICADHPDLAGRILPGYDFVDDDDVPQDTLGHGCGVAGIVAAAIDNGLGIAGVAPNARIMPLRVLDAQGVGTYSDVAAAIVYAADSGARIINLSLGGANPSSVLQNAINYAVSKGVMVIAAAGNTGGSVLYPAAYAPVIAVAAVDSDLGLSSFSSYGPQIDVLAPGRDIFTITNGGGYATMSGTSFAAPHVAGVAALKIALGQNLTFDGGLIDAGTSDDTPTLTPQPSPTAPPLVDSSGGLTGWLSMVQGDPQDISQIAPLIFVLADDNGQNIAELTIDPYLGSRFHNQRVHVSGQLAPQGTGQTGLPVYAVDTIQGVGAAANQVNAAVTGSQPWINLLCKFSDVSAEPHTPAAIDGMFGSSYPGLNHFFQQLSYNFVDIDGTATTAQWYTLPHPRDYYIVNNTANLNALANDCTAVADADIYFPDYVGVNMFFNATLDCCSWGGGRTMLLDGVMKAYRTTWLANWAHAYDYIGHEMGHGFGMMHSTGPADNPPLNLSIYISRWDVMSRSGGTCSAYDSTFGCIPPGAIADSRDKVGWIPANRKVTVTSGQNVNVTLDRLQEPNSGSSTLLAVVPIASSSDRYYTVEARLRNGGYDYNVPGNAVIIHDVDNTRTTNGGFAYVVDADDGNDDVNDAGSMWTVGETFYDATTNITISVLSATSESFTVNIINNSLNIFTSCASIAQIPVSECNALVALYDNTAGGAWTNKAGWKQNSLPCNWYGVTCDSGHISQLNLQSNNLSGTLPASLGDLTSLIYLNLDSNRLTGGIPAALGSLTQLQQLWLGYNGVSGPGLTGTIPVELGGLDNLQLLGLERNGLTGTIPTQLGGMDSLRYLRLWGNQLTGTIPTELGGLTNLIELSLDNNHLEGGIPPQIGGIATLEQIWLENNRLSGGIPLELGGLPNLQVLRLYNNALSGEVPAQIANLTTLLNTDIGYNKLVSTDPTVVSFLDSKDPDWAATQTIPPTNVRITAVAANSVTVAWDTIPYTGDGGYYEVRYSTTSGEPYESSGCTTADKSATTCDVTGLTPGVVRYFAVRSYTPAHGSQQNDLQSGYSGEVNTALASPTDFAFGTIGQNSLVLNWNYPAGSGIDFWVEHSTNGTTWNGAPLVVQGTSSTQTGLTCGSTHYYRLRAHRVADSVLSAVVGPITTTTTACPALSAPSGLNASTVSRIQINLTWTDESSGQTDKFLVERAEDGGPWWQIAQVTAPLTSYADSTLKCGTTYQYRVKAYRSQDKQTSDVSNTGEATTTACPPAVNNAVGLYYNGLWQFRDRLSDGPSNLTFGFGPTESGWIQVVGDWDGNGEDGIGLYKNGIWVLRDNTNSGTFDYVFTFGPTEAGWLPVVGDWNGDDIDTIGVYKNGLWALRNSNTAGNPDRSYVFNPLGTGVQPVTGDWNGDGIDTVGVFKAGLWVLHNSHTDAINGTGFTFGPAEAGWLPVVGDWNGDNIDTIGVYKDGIWRLRNSNSAGQPDIGFTFGQGLTGWQPVTSYRSGVGGLSLLADGGPWTPPETPTATVTPEETATETTVPTDLPPTQPPEVTAPPEVTETPVVTDAPPTETPVPTESPVATETPPPTDTPSPEPLSEVTSEPSS